MSKDRHVQKSDFVALGHLENVLFLALRDFLPGSAESALRKPTLEVADPLDSLPPQESL